MRLLVLILLVWWIDHASAQTAPPDPLVWNVIETHSPMDGNGLGPTHSSMYTAADIARLAPHLPPPPFLIVAASVGSNAYYPQAPGCSGTVNLEMDPNGDWVRATGFPNSQTPPPGDNSLAKIVTLDGIFVARPGMPNVDVQNFPVPFVFHPTDVLLTAFAGVCPLPGGGYGAQDMSWNITVVPLGPPPSPPPPPPNTVTFDAKSAQDTATSGAASSISASNLTVGAGANRALVAEVSIGTKAAMITGCSWGAQPLTMLAASNSPDAVKGRVELWGLIAPMSGVQPMTCNFSQATYAFMASASFAGVDQVSPFQTPSTAQDASASPLIAVSGAAGDMAVAGIAGGTTINAPGPGTSIYIDNSGSGPIGGAASYAATGTGRSFPWSLFAAKFWAAAGINIHASQ